MGKTSEMSKASTTSETSEIRCVVLDVDDTCYLERDYVRSGFQAVDRHIGGAFDIQGFFAAAWDAFERGVRGKIFNEALAALDMPAEPAIIDELVAVYRQHEPEIELLADVAVCIDHWRKLGTRLAVITDGPLSSQRAKTRALGLDSLCDPVIHTAALGAGRSKPHPAAYERVEQITGIKAAACLYIADNPSKDFISPHERGWASLRLRREGGLHAHLDGGQADWELADLRSAPETLRRRLSWP